MKAKTYLEKHAKQISENNRKLAFRLLKRLTRPARQCRKGKQP